MTCAVVVLGKHHRWCETCQQAWLVPEGVDTPCLKRDAAKEERARIVAMIKDLEAELWKQKPAGRGPSLAHSCWDGELASMMIVRAMVEGDE